MRYKEKIEYRTYRLRYYFAGLYVDEERVVKIIPYRYRFDPVPGVIRRRHGHYYRRIHTTQERRWAYAYKGYFRAGRNAKNLPNSWDDRLVGARKDRSWKRCTKKQRQWE